MIREGWRSHSGRPEAPRQEQAWYRKTVREDSGLVLGGGGQAQGWDRGAVRDEAAEVGRDPNVDVSRSETEMVRIVLNVMCRVWRGFGGWNRTI